MLPDLVFLLYGSEQWRCVKIALQWEYGLAAIPSSEIFQMVVGKLPYAEYFRRGNTLLTNAEVVAVRRCNNRPHGIIVLGLIIVMSSEA